MKYLKQFVIGSSYIVFAPFFYAVEKSQPKKTYSFMKKTGSKSLGLLFGKTKEEKLELFIKNIKIIHPNMPDFWLQKVIENFKKKFNIEELI